MPLNSAPKFVVSSGNHSNTTTQNNNNNHHHHHHHHHCNNNNNNNNSNSSGGGKLLICLRDLSKFRDQTSKSPSGMLQCEVGGNKTSPTFRNPTDAAQKISSSDFKSISTVIKSENTDQDASSSNNNNNTNTINNNSNNGNSHPSSSEDGHPSPQRFDSQAGPESDEGGAGSTSPKSEPADDPRRREEVAMAGDDAVKDGDPTKQLNKLKRFLSTLQQFANDISKDIGDCVQTLICWLVHAKISVEDFHRRLQQATNFPLRPFVVPFLKASLPLLQMEIAQHSRHSPNLLLHPTAAPKNGGGGGNGNAGGSLSGFGIPLLPSRFHFFPPSLNDLPPLLIPFSGAVSLTNGNAFQTDLPRSELEMTMSHHSRRAELNGNGKRTMSPDASPNSSTTTSSSSALMTSSLSRPSFKKRRSIPTITPNTPNTTTTSNTSSTSPPQPPLVMMTSSSDPTLNNFCIDLYKPHKSQESMTDHKLDGDKKDSSLNVILDGAWERFEERSSQIENLLLTLLNVADKCSQKMVTMKAQTRQDFERITSQVLRDLMEQRTTHQTTSGDYLQKMDAKMKTDKVVNEVKQQAMLEMQRAVAAAEAKASLTVANERMRLERLLDDARKQAKQEILDILNRQEESNENCWNCGRFASETCSGCNEARYCGLFCQHKDWESHHKVCRQAQERSGEQAKASPLVPRNLLVPVDGLSPWSMVPNFLIGRSPFLVQGRASKSEEAAAEATRPPVVPAIKVERRDTPPAIDVNSNVISSSVSRERNHGSDSTSPKKEDKNKDDHDVEQKRSKNSP